MSDTIDQANDLAEHQLAEALATRHKLFPTIARCSKCDGLNDRPNYAVCSACLKPEAQR